MLNGDDIDITRFAFLQTNPADGGRYINSDSHFMVDPESTVRGLARLLSAGDRGSLAFDTETP